MIAFLGHLSILLALAVAASGAIVSFASKRSGAIWSRRAAFAVLGFVSLAVLLMEIALVSHDFSVRYVAEVGSRETPLYYTVISLWAALEGSILFWAFLLSVYTCAFIWLARNTMPDLQRGVTGIMLAISTFFLFVVSGPGNPFTTQSPAPADGPGPNVLLQNHPMMGLHPPLLYLGYVGLAVPFAIAMASLLAGAPGPDVLRLIRRWALIPWICLSLGIVAGMWWSYAVLGWGGYWAWDPVENASVMPWLVTTAFLHSLQVQERRQMLKTWTLCLIIAAFVLSILGTFLTRSGVLASVHSFTQSAIGPLFLAFFGVVLVGSLGLLFARSGELASGGALESTVCRETAFLFNNLLLVAITFTILLGTIFPLIAEAIQGTQLSVGAPYFNHVAVPIGFALLFLMGVGPALPWGAARLEELQYRLLPPVAIGVLVVLLLLALDVRGVGALVTFGAAAFVLAVTIGRIASDARVRRGNTREGLARSVGRLLRANPRRYGGYLVHVGVLLVIVGIAASQTYQVRKLVTVRPGQAVTLAGYRLLYRGWKPIPQPAQGRMVTQATLAVTRGNDSLGSLSPSQNFYIARQQPVVTPAVREEPFEMLAAMVHGGNPLPDLAQLLQGRNPFEDLYVVLNGVTSKPSGPATLQILVNPMVGFIWLGGLVVGMGGVVALIPARRRRRISVPIAEPISQPGALATPEEARA